MPRKSTTFISDAGQVIECDAVSAYPEELVTPAARMAAMVGAPMKRIVTEPDSVSPYPSTMVRRRRVVFIEDVPIQKVVSNTRYGKSPEWLTNPEAFRCDECKRYCSSSFIVDGLCAYCRGIY